MMTEKGVYEVLWPRGEKVVQQVPYAQRLDTLEGKTICELWDWIFRGDEIFPVIEKELTKRYPGVKLVNYEAFGCTHGGDEAEAIAALSDRLKENNCDAVISGLGC